MKYSEPTNYIPKNIRKELGLGEFNKDVQKKPADTGKKQNTGKKK